MLQLPSMRTGTDATTASGYASRELGTFGTLIADRWWTLVVRGAAAIVFGIFALAAPRTSVLALVLIWGVYAILDGVVHLMSAWRSGLGGRGWLVVEGLISVAAGAVAFAWTELTALVLLWTIAAWAVLTGIAKIAASYKLRRELEGEWLLALAGALSIVFGVILFVAPDAGIVALLWIIGFYAIVFGTLLIALGARLRSWRREPPAPSEPMPAGA